MTALISAWRTRRDPVPGESSNRAGLALLAAILFVYFASRYENFLTAGNFVNISVSNAAILMAAIGSMALLVSGNVDISIGSMYGLASVLIAEVVSGTGSAILGVITGLIVGCLLGGFNGVLVRWLPISPLIVTLATLGFYRGLAYLITDGSAVTGFPDSFLEIGRGGFGDLTYTIIVAIAVFVAVAVWLTRSRTGLRIYAMGGDPRAAALSGVRVERITVLLYAMNGLIIGLLAVLTTARLNLGDPSTGTQFEFDVLTAVILGGVAFAGGGGRPIGVFAGVLLLAIINAGLIFEGLADYWQQIVKGALLLVALGADQYAQHQRERRRQPASTQPQEAKAMVLHDRLGSHARDVAPAAAGNPVLEARGMTKQYGALLAVDGVDLSVGTGEVVAVVGDNGAGKSTFIKMLSGAVEPDSGRISVNGRALELRSPGAAHEAGIRTVYQDLALCAHLSVAHNFVLGHEPIKRRFGLFRVRDDGVAEQRAEHYLSSLGIRLKSYRTVVRLLSGGQRQTLAIARAVEESPRVAILDEPTAALGVAQTQNVLELVRTVAKRGTAVILISHDVQTVLEVADRVVVLRLGRVVFDGDVAELSKLELLELMAGFAEGDDVSSTGSESHRLA